jgi:predicted alpha/beta-hydrolase family hydrolase
LKGIAKPVVVVQMPRAPFGRSDGFGMEFLPDFSVVQKSIDAIKDRTFLVMVGAGEPLVKYTGIDLDLSNKTTVSDLIDVAYAANGFLGQCSFIVPLAECFSKPVHIIWSRAHTRSAHVEVRRMTPEKILHGERSAFSYDDQEVSEVMDAFCKQVRVPTLV